MSLQPKNLSFIRRIQAKLSRSKYLTVSALVHVFIVVTAGSVVLMSNQAPPPDFTAGDGGLLNSDSGSDLPPPPETKAENPDNSSPAPEPETSTQVLQAINVTGAAVNAQTMSFSTTPVTQTQLKLSNDVKASNFSSGDLGKAAAVKFTAGGMNAMGGRVGAARQKAMMANGAKPASEQTVLKALRWFKANQSENGSWGNHLGLSGLVVLSFLGHGDLPNSSEFGPTVKRGVDFVLDAAKKGGTIGSSTYMHGIVTYALSEYYTMTQDDRVKEAVVQSLRTLIAGQGADGGWRYTYPSDSSDLSVAAWQVQAMKAGHLTGLKVEGLEGAMDKAMKYIASVQGPKGGFGYTSKADTASLSGAGALCLLFWKGKDRMADKAVDFVLDISKKDYPIKYMDAKADLYGWYYNAQACMMTGGDAWKTWNRLFQDEMIKAQAEDGSFPPMAHDAHGGFQTADTVQAKVYRTVLCTLMLEVYYRYAPTAKSS